LTVLLLTDHDRAPEDVLPALCRVPYTVKVSPTMALPDDPAPPADVVLVDAREDLATAKDLCRSLRGRAPDQPLIAVFTPGGLITLNEGWRVDDVVLNTAGTDELTMRLRLATSRRTPACPRPERRGGHGPLEIDAAARSVKLCGREIELTYTEFEIVAFLARRPGQTVDHHLMLDHLYGGDPRGSTRALHTHIRRIRRKFGPEHTRLISCVHGIGYRLMPGA
jgi:DNA-binding response OmpR family regulator